MTKRILIVVALAAIIALPFLLRPKRATAAQADVTLVIITPHNEAIRHEFEIGFERWYRARTGKRVFIDWRVIGGTSEIARYLGGEYVAAFRYDWTHRLGRPWSYAVQAAFANPAVKPGPDPARDTPAEAARRAFLASNVSCGLDLFFGGGSFDFARQAALGQAVDSGIMRLHPEWFTDAVIPQTYTGEPYWDPQGRWHGDVLSSFGMLYNKDACARLGLAHPPRQWADLADPRLFNQVALADPTKSGSITEAFENMIQQQMHREWARLRAEAKTDPALARLTPAELEARAVSAGWLRAMKLVQLIGANARYFTDTSQKPPIDVSQGDAAVGMCIDFYGRYQAEAVQRRDGTARLEYVEPRGGTVYSVDPIAMLRGAPHPRVALAFIEYVLSMGGQKLWDFKVGAPGGPQQFALRRIPVRKDYYAHPEFTRWRSDPEVEPYAEKDQLVYVPAWTEKIFNETAFVIRVMCMDTHPELQAAWRAVIRAGEPPQAMAALQDMSAVTYEQVTGSIHRTLSSRNQVEALRLANTLAAQFRANYARAEKLAAERK